MSKSLKNNGKKLWQIRRFNVRVSKLIHAAGLPGQTIWAKLAKIGKKKYQLSHVEPNQRHSLKSLPTYVGASIKSEARSASVQ